MARLYSCVHGHRWQRRDDEGNAAPGSVGVCPVCGGAAEAPGPDLPATVAEAGGAATCSQRISSPGVVDVTPAEGASDPGGTSAPFVPSLVPLAAGSRARFTPVRLHARGG